MLVQQLTLCAGKFQVSRGSWTVIVSEKDVSWLKPTGPGSCASGGNAAGGFIQTPDSVSYCRIQLLFWFSAMKFTGIVTGSKSFDCALVSVLGHYEGPLAGDYMNYLNHLNYSFVLQ